MHRLDPGATIIGRSRKSLFRLEEDGVSRAHAEVRVDPDGTASARDCGSTNGTLVNGRPLTREFRTLQDGDRVQVGGAVILKFSYQDHLEESFQQKLYASAVRDPLTGVYNKRYLTERLDQEFAAAERRATPLSIIVLDLDHFKRVNTDHGHAGGDEVLRAVAQHIEKALRREEIFARYGGEEFVILMRETTLASAMKAAERVRELVEALEIPFGGKIVRVTASFGVDSTDGAWHKNALRLFIAADRNLYRAKHLGRNVVCGPAREDASTTIPIPPDDL